MKALTLLIALLVSGCAQVSLTVYSDSSGASYTTVNTNEGTRIVITRKSIIEKEEQNGTGD